MSRLAIWLKNSDDLLLHYVHLKIKCTFLDRWMSRITHFGCATFTISIVLMMFLFSIHLGLEGFLTLASSHLLVHILKKSFSRSRPYLSHDNVFVVGNPLQDYSFPSGHSTAIFSVVTTLSLAVSGLGFLLFPVAGAVGISRIYLGHHYPTDVMIGASIGIGFAMIIHMM